MARLVLAAILVVALAACSSLGIGTGGSAPVRGLDILGDNVASTVFAIDLPLTVEPVLDASTVAFLMKARTGETRRVDAELVPADAEDVMGRLPPPAADRTYYLFAFAESDQAALRNAQAWAKGQPAGSVETTVDIQPRLCATAATDPAETRFSILATLPGAGSLVPMVNAQAVSLLLKASGEANLPACAGHSG